MTDREVRGCLEFIKHYLETGKYDRATHDVKSLIKEFDARYGAVK